MHEGHRERMKNRFLSEGLDNFEQHQILELLLYYSIPRRDTNPIAHKLLDIYGSISGVFDADPVDIVKKTNLTMNTALLLTLIPSLTRVYMKDKWGSKPLVNSSVKAGEYAVALLAGEIYEVFYVLCLDSQNRVNYPAKVHEGTIDSAPVYPRIIVETALRHKANSIILVHNHPGGSLMPSAADRDATRKIITACEAISVKVIDHIIVAGNDYFSFADNRML